MRRRSLVLAGAMAQKPNQGGHAWVFLQYLLGFRLLGWDVLFLDRLDAAECRDQRGNPCSVWDSFQLSYLMGVLGDYELEESFSLLVDSRKESVGLPYSCLCNRIRNCDLLLDVNGFIRDERILASAPCKVFIDIDPGFTQLWDVLRLDSIPEGYDRYATVGRNIGQDQCLIPKAGREWITLPPPAVLEYFPKAETFSRPFTLICSWRGAYGPITYRERLLGQRPREFRRFIRVPRLSGQDFQLALKIDAADRNDLALLRENRWDVIPATSVAATPAMYANFIRESKAEFEVAKNLYVDTRSGWFSDRSVCYLACGKPVIVQDTGLSGSLPTDAGLLPFSTLEEAVDCILKVERDYPHHCRRARDIAAEHFESQKVIRRLLQAVGLA